MKLLIALVVSPVLLIPAVVIGTFYGVVAFWKGFYTIGSEGKIPTFWDLMDL